MRCYLLKILSIADLEIGHKFLAKNAAGQAQAKTMTRRVIRNSKN